MDEQEKNIYENNKKVMNKMIVWIIGSLISFVVFLLMIFIIVKVARLAWGK